MPLRLFNISMGGVVREVNCGLLGGGVSLLSGDGREWNVSQLQMVADSQERLRQLVEEFGRVCEGRTLRVNENKSKVVNVALNGELLEEVECLKYLGSHVAVDGGRAVVNA